MKLLFHAAEAKIYRTKEGILKDRIVKTYRHSALDTKLRRIRTRAEARLLQKAKHAGIPVPHLLHHTETTLIVEEIQGKKLADTLDTAKNKQALMQELGTTIANLHNAHLIHGDLTTSNILLTNKPAKKVKQSKNKQNLSPKHTRDNSHQQNKANIVIIDFGLGSESARIEDKATDLHVFKEALEAKHYQHAETLWKTFLKGYNQTTNNKNILKQLTKVEARGRYKQQF